MIFVNKDNKTNCQKCNKEFDFDTLYLIKDYFFGMEKDELWLCKKCAKPHIDRRNKIVEDLKKS